MDDPSSNGLANLLFYVFGGFPAYFISKYVFSKYNAKQKESRLFTVLIVLLFLLIFAFYTYALATSDIGRWFPNRDV